MFNLSGSEIIVILLLALVVLGPDKLPEAMRRAGKTYAEIKKLSSGFQDEVRKGFDEPAREVKKTAAAVKSAARKTTDTVTGKDTIKAALEDAGKDKPRYNPATDAAPELPEGSSVADPITEAAPAVVDPTADEVTADAAPEVEAADAIEPVGVADAVAAGEPVEATATAGAAETAAPGEIVESEPLPDGSVEADRTA